MQTRRIFIVEDSLTMRAMLETFIAADRRLDICGSVASADEALKQLAAAHPDVVLLDLDMPGLDGMGFLDKVQAQINDPWCPLQVVIVSSRTCRDAPICEDAFARGASACFDKALLSGHAGELLALLRSAGTFALRDDAFNSRAITLPSSFEASIGDGDPTPPDAGPITFV